MARLAPDRPTRRALAGGILSVILSALGAIAKPNHVPALGPIDIRSL
jgi:hypothetical protein